MNNNTHLLQALIASPMFLEFQSSFIDATGLPLILKSADDWHPAFSGVRNENAFCKMIAGENRACASCLCMQEKLCNAAREGRKVLSCPFGLVEIAVPLKLGNEVIGLLISGQVLRSVPTEEAIEKVCARLREMGVKRDSGRVRDMLLGTRIMTTRQLDSIARMLAIFAEHMAMKSNVLAIREANSEPVAVFRTRQFIESNFSEDVSLADAAKAAHTSIYYLCKLLRKSLGVSFTELLSRRRVENAKELLANPNLRVSEIAFQTGFQSVTHFNRIFRKLVGESPTKYRSISPLALAA